MMLSCVSMSCVSMSCEIIHLLSLCSNGWSSIVAQLFFTHDMIHTHIGRTAEAGPGCLLLRYMCVCVCVCVCDRYVCVR